MKPLSVCNVGVLLVTIALASSLIDGTTTRDQVDNQHVVHKSIQSELIGHLEDQIPLRRVKRQAKKYLEARNLSTEYYDGEPVVKSSFYDCPHWTNCTISNTFDHKETVRHSGTLGFKLEAGSVLEICPTMTVGKGIGSGVSTSYKFEIFGHSRGRLMFQPKLMKIRGVMIMKAPCRERSGRIISGILTLGLSELINKDVADCEDHDMGPFEIIVPVSTHRGNKNDELDGVWFVEYSSNPMPLDDLNYHNIRNRDIKKLPEDLQVEGTVANPIMCGQYAKAHGYKVAVYKNATCVLKKTLSSVDIEIHTRRDEFIGAYTIDAHNSNRTTSEELKTRWVKRKSCDMIDYNKEYFVCKNFPRQPGAVILFKKESESASRPDDDYAGEPVEN